MRPRKAKSLTDNGLVASCRRGLLVDHSAEHEARPQSRNQADRSSQTDPRLAQFGDVPGREVLIAGMRRTVSRLIGRDVGRLEQEERCGAARSRPWPLAWGSTRTPAGGDSGQRVRA